MDEEQRPTRTRVKPVIKIADTPDRLTQDFGSLLPNSNNSSVPEVRNPDRQWFIRVHPTWKFPCYLFEDATDLLIYLVSANLSEKYSDVLRKKILYPAITNRNNVLFFWNVNLGNRKNTYNRSAMEAVELAKTTWIRVYCDTKSRSYKTYPAQGQIAKPQFPSEKDLEDLVLRAFKGKTITDEDHPALKRIRGIDP